MLCVHGSPFPLPLNSVSLLHEESGLLPWDWHSECVLCGNRWKVTRTGVEASWVEVVVGGKKRCYLKAHLWPVKYWA